ncbi:CatB-related O-acetyltransferase [Halobacillus hunanensis]|uniref:CatB-related O-acetyltransferase n=1 Tax=Halobacillus hunanensis TaxID=578214 RepID=UPI0015912C5A|nr:CatB-related O-acetyltransferase [Halobacillus hunanensis]
MKFSYLFAKLIKKIHLPAIKNSYINKTAKVCSGSHVIESVIDSYSYVGNFSSVNNTYIGKFCSIADKCAIGGASHPLNWVSSSPVFHQGKNIMKKNFSHHDFNPYQKTTIGNDVWIGSNSLIKSGITIENGAVIGMGSIVTKNVGAYEIWAGNPAKLIRKRFSEGEINMLQNSKWWEWDEHTLAEKSKYFNDIEKFLERLGE